MTENLLVNEFKNFCIRYYKLFIEVCERLDKALWVEMINLNIVNLNLANNWTATLNDFPSQRNLITIFDDRGYSYRLEDIDLKTLVELYPKISTNLISDFLEKFQLKFFIVFNKIIKVNPNLYNIYYLYFNKELVFDCLYESLTNIKGVGLLTSSSKYFCSLVYSNDKETHISNINMKHILSLGRKLWKEIEVKS